MNPEMESENGEGTINVDFTPNPSTSLTKKENPAGETSKMPQSTFRIKVTKEQGRESVTILENAAGENTVSEP